jgi:hypothetical protein
MPTESSDIPKDIQKVRQRLEGWPSAHTGCLPTLKRMWTAAVGWRGSDASVITQNRPLMIT